MSSSPPRPFVEMKQIADCFLERIRPACERAELAGSLRRRRPECRDIEVVAIPRFSKRVHAIEKPGDLFAAATTVETVEKVNDTWARVDELADSGSFSKRGERFRQFCFAGAKVDVFLADQDNWGNIFLIRTGSADFSHWLMGELNTRGYTSHEGRIHRHDGTKARNPHGPPLSTPDEVGVFRLAGHMYIDPNKREISPGVRRAR